MMASALAEFVHWVEMNRITTKIGKLRMLLFPRYFSINILRTMPKTEADDSRVGRVGKRLAMTGYG
jgi:hypothetical protein